MSIGPSSELENIIKRVEISKSNFQNLEANEFLTHIWNTSRNIWEDKPADPKFPSHDLTHSENIINYFMKIDNLFHWENYEKLIFVTASMIHDIGMQYNSWGIPKNTRIGKFNKSYYEDNFIRINHAEIGFELISAQIHNNLDKKISFPKNFCSFSDNDSKNALADAARIAFSHTGTQHLEYIKKDLSFNRKTIFGEQYRPRLLACILRFCDELDLDYRRVKNPEKFNSYYMKKTSKIHWLACWYVQRVEINIINDVPQVKVFWRVPENYNVYDCETIKNLIDNLRIHKIYNEHEFIRMYLKECNEPLKCDFHILPLINDAENFIDEDFFLKELDLIRDFNKKFTSPKGKKTDVVEKRIPIKKNYEIAKYKKTDLDHINLEKNIIKWYDEHKIVGHFELANLEHTDKYIVCRSLVSNQELLRKISNEIYTVQKKILGHEIHQILAVGTSAIPIAINTAYRFSPCTVTFTFSEYKSKYLNLDNNQEETRNHKYNKFEVLPIIDKTKSVLIIDDIISGGIVAKDIIERYLVGVKEIFHHSILKLGIERSYSWHKGISDYQWIVHIPDVFYSFKGRCRLCKENEYLTKET